MQKKWITRVRLRPENVDVDSMIVCSDHFEDDDFINSGLLQVDMLQQIGKLEDLVTTPIRLKQDAVPNTDRTTGQLRIGPPKAKKSPKRAQDCSYESHSISDPAVKRVCQNLTLEEIAEPSRQDELLLGYAPHKSSPTLPITRPETGKLRELRVTRVAVPLFSYQTLDQGDVLLRSNETLVDKLFKYLVEPIIDLYSQQEKNTYRPGDGGQNNSDRGHLTVDKGHHTGDRGRETDERGHNTGDRGHICTGHTTTHHKRPAESRDLCSRQKSCSHNISGVAGCLELNT